MQTTAECQAASTYRQCPPNPAETLRVEKILRRVFSRDRAEARRSFNYRAITPTCHVSRDALATAETFGAEHPEGWVWITDLRGLIWTSPRSLFYVRRIRKLPNNRGYAVIARLPFRLLGRAFGRAFGAESFVATPEQALSFAAKQV